MNRGTQRLASDLKLSRLLVDYYRDEAAQRGITDRYEEQVRMVQPRLEQLSRRGVESAFVLHALVCTWMGRLTPNWQTWPYRALDAPGTRRAMLRAVRALTNVGRATIVGLFGGPDEARGARFYVDLGILEQVLSGGTYRNPAFQVGGPRAPGPRQREVDRRACVACLMTALDGQPKRAAEVAQLMERFGLLRAGKGHRSGWVKRRYRLDGRKLKDHGSGVGMLVTLLRASFEGLEDYLAPRPVKPVSRERLRKRASRWGIPVSIYERRFRDFCQLAGVKANAEGLRKFEVNLRANSEARGGPTKYRTLLLEGPFLNEGSRIEEI